MTSCLKSFNFKSSLNLLTKSLQALKRIHANQSLALFFQIQDEISRMKSQGVSMEAINAFAQKQRMMLTSSQSGSNPRQPGSGTSQSGSTRQSGSSAEQPTIEEVVHMSHSMMDVMDSRIEGMESFMDNMQKTMSSLRRKVSSAFLFILSIEIEIIADKYNMAGLFIQNV